MDGAEALTLPRARHARPRVTAHRNPGPQGIADLRAKVDGETAAQAVFGDRASNVLDALAIAQADGPAQGK